MTLTTLCYIEQNDQYLMLHRIRKENDLNEGKWIGVGGHVEKGETPEQCIRRETKEETGLTLGGVKLRGVVDFLSERWEDEAMYLYTSDSFSGEMHECDEGVLRWVPKREVYRLNLWEGDRIFLDYLLTDEPFFHLELRYDAEDRLISSRRLPSVILASASPRRQELMRQIGIEPIIIPSELPEERTETEPRRLVQSLADRKAEEIARRFSHGEMVIGADTMVTAGGRMLGKPATHEEAARMIGMLAGHTHQVLTGVSVIRCGGKKERKKIRFVEETAVHVAPMTEEEILLYAESGEPMDKAGAYGIQGPFAAFISGIDGDFYNVMGLPLHRVWEALKKLESV